MTTKDEVKRAAWALGKLMAEAEQSDDYDVLEELAQGYATGMGKATEVEPFLLAQLTALDSLQAAAQTVIEWRVADAREGLTSWSKIGDALSTTKQAAQQRFGK